MTSIKKKKFCFKNNVPKALDQDNPNGNNLQKSPFTETVEAQRSLQASATSSLALFSAPLFWWDLTAWRLLKRELLWIHHGKSSLIEFGTCPPSPPS